jgi:MerR family transcriptional regulator, copper efflux regulator
MAAPELHSVRQVCDKIGVSARTLRYYEELGLLPGVRRRSGGRRAYGHDEIERLRFIQRLKSLGLSLQEVGELNAVYAIHGSTRAMLDKLRELLRQHLAGLEEKVRDLQTLQTEMKRYLEHVERRADDLAERERDEKEKKRAHG